MNRNLNGKQMKGNRLRKQEWLADPIRVNSRIISGTYLITDPSVSGAWTTEIQEITVSAVPAFTRNIVGAMKGCFAFWILFTRYALILTGLLRWFVRLSRKPRRIYYQPEEGQILSIAISRFGTCANNINGINPMIPPGQVRFNVRRPTVVINVPAWRASSSL